MKSLRKSIIMCGVSMALCVGMFAGATFAWFTDSVSNAGNKINSGTLDIEATVQENDPNGTEGAGLVDPRDPNNELEVTWGAARDLAGEPNVPFINDESFEPDGWNAKLITVYNKGDLPAKIKIFFDMQDAGLADSMWFCLSGYAIKFGDPNTFNTGLQPMSKIAEVTEGLVSLVLDPVGTPGDFDRAEYTFLYGMNANAGNEYKNKSLTMSVNILATQTNDKADFPALDSKSLQDAFAAITPGSTKALSLGADITLGATTAEEVLRVTEGATVAMDLNGKALSVPRADASASLDDNRFYRPIEIQGGNMTVSNGTLDAAGGGANKDDGTGAYGTVSMSGGSLTLENMTLKNARPYGLNVKVNSGATAVLRNTTIDSTVGGGIEVSGGTASLYDCVVTQRGYFDHCSSCVSASSGGTLNVYSTTYRSEEGYGVYVFNSGATINVYGGSFYGGKAVLKVDKGTNFDSVINVYGGEFEGTILVQDGAYMHIYGGTFKNTGLSLEAFKAFVATGYQATESNGVFTVTKA